MRHFVHQTLPALCLAVLMATAAAAQNRSTSQRGDVIQSVPPTVSQNPQLLQLNLTDNQRAKIKKVLSTKNTEVSFGLKTSKPAQSFDAAVGAKIPAALKPHALPPPLIYEIPKLKRYSYLKFKGKVLLVNPMSRKIVATCFQKPEARPSLPVPTARLAVAWTNLRPSETMQTSEGGGRGDPKITQPDLNQTLAGSR